MLVEYTENLNRVLTKSEYLFEFVGVFILSFCPTKMFIFVGFMTAL